MKFSASPPSLAARICGRTICYNGQHCCCCCCCCSTRRKSLDARLAWAPPHQSQPQLGSPTFARDGALSHFRIHCRRIIKDEMQPTLNRSPAAKTALWQLGFALGSVAISVRRNSTPIKDQRRNLSPPGRPSARSTRSASRAQVRTNYAPPGPMRAREQLDSISVSSCPWRWRSSGMA